MPPKSNFDDGELDDCSSSTRLQYNPSTSMVNLCDNKECGITHKVQSVTGFFRRRDKSSAIEANVSELNSNRNTSFEISSYEKNDVEQIHLVESLIDVSLDDDNNDFHCRHDSDNGCSNDDSDVDNAIPQKVEILTSSALKLVFGAFGIYSSYLVYGHIQEDLFLYKSPINGESFTYAWFLQTLESFVIVTLGSFMILWNESDIRTLPKRHFFQSGASQVMAKTFTSLALSAGLSFPVCTLAKSAKIVPVMIGQIVLGKTTKYKLRDYLFAILLVSGTALLSMNTGKGGGDGSSISSVSGVFWIVASLVMDGVTAGLQKRIQNDATHSPPRTLDFLLLTNLSMGVVALTVTILLPTRSPSSSATTNEFMAALNYLRTNHEALKMVSTLCCCSFIGQSFIFFIIAQFDPLVCSTITTTRKILSVLWSILTKGHSVSIQGQFGIMLAVGGLILEVSDKTFKQTVSNGKSNQALGNAADRSNTFSILQGHCQTNKQAQCGMVQPGSSQNSYFKPKAYAKKSLLKDFRRS